MLQTKNFLLLLIFTVFLLGCDVEINLNPDGADSDFDQNLVGVWWFEEDFNIGTSAGFGFEITKTGRIKLAECSDNKIEVDATQILYDIDRTEDNEILYYRISGKSDELFAGYELDGDVLQIGFVSYDSSQIGIYNGVRSHYGFYDYYDYYNYYGDGYNSSYAEVCHLGNILFKRAEEGGKCGSEPPSEDSYEPNNNLASANTIEVGDTQVHALNRYDGVYQDWIKFTLDSTQTVTIDVDSSCIDSVITLYDSNGDYMDYDDDSYSYGYLDSSACTKNTDANLGGCYLDPRLTRTLSSGTYYIEVKPYGYSSGYSFGYGYFDYGGYYDAYYGNIGFYLLELR